ncbi:hypothetical protein Q4488_13130 [Amphritea sp. 1_MG-2023]|uniref:hypothetical protein n=1 Tax=Amphritea sp. 1_MG-2023 TaxID=3062670 RepID=UPI0026E17F59|nr:hypothetical protein [Amphritea sp. 1_MG-2023]MDO6564332.1 hypothetical protein [Amphritea sp. 1_MG-2023]
MRTILILSCCLAPIWLTGCVSSSTSEYPEYAGSGGMTQWDIQPQAYLYHYEHGFNGVDSLGYAAALQTVWSRLGAAITCGIEYDKPYMIQQLMQTFDEQAITHELNGIGFHRIQSRKVPQFCNEWRVREIHTALRRYRQGWFE